MNDALRIWFNQSVVTTPDGSPRQVFHGSRKPIKLFQPRPAWFSEGRGLAAIYSMGDEDGYLAGSTIITAHLQIRNPLDLAAKGLAADDYVNAVEFFGYTGLTIPGIQGINGRQVVHEILNSPAFVQSARNAGYDGVRITEHDSSSDAKKRGSDQVMTWCVFAPSQIQIVGKAHPMTKCHENETEPQSKPNRRKKIA